MTWTGKPLPQADLAAFMRRIHSELDRRRGAGDEMATRSAVRAHPVCRYIIDHFLGADWYSRNSSLQSSPSSYFHPAFDGPDPDTQTAWAYTARMFALAECLFNMQAVENVANPINALQDDDQMESAVAELLFGMMLFQEGVAFRYLQPSREQGVKTPDI